MNCFKNCMFVLFCFFPVLTFLAHADQVTLRSGEIINGEFQGGNENNIFLIVQGKGKVISIDNIENVIFESKKRIKKTHELNYVTPVSMMVVFSKAIDSNTEDGTPVYAALLQPVLIGQVEFEQGSMMIGKVIGRKDNKKISWLGIRKGRDEYLFSKDAVITQSAKKAPKYESESVLYVATPHKPKKANEQSVRLNGKNINVLRGTTITLKLSAKTKKRLNDKVTQ